MNLKQVEKNRKQEKKDKKEKEIKELIAKTGETDRECKRCHGRGYIGYDVIFEKFIICRCLRKKKA